MTVNSSANSVILILVAFSDILSAENSKLSAESGLPGGGSVDLITNSLLPPTKKYVFDCGNRDG